jgi:hypothetical protein
MSKLFQILLIIFILVSWNACGESRFSRLVKPVVMNEVFGAGNSFFYLPVSLSVKALEEIVNQKLEGIFYEGEAGGSLFLQLERARPFELESRSDGLHYSIGVRFRARKSLTLAKVGVEGVLLISFVSGMRVGEDWKLETETELLSYEWLEKPKVKVGPFGIPIQFLVDQALEKSRDSLGKLVDKSLAEALPLKEQLAFLWDMMQKPYLVEEGRKLWLLFHPQALSVAPFVFAPGEIHFAIQLWARPEVSVEEEQPLSYGGQSLPALRQWPGLTAPAGLMQFPLFVPFTVAEKLAKAELIGQTFRQGRYALTIEDIHLRPTGEKMQVLAEVSGSFSGTIEMEGLPAFDKDSRKVEILDLGLNLKSRNVLQKVLVALFKKRIRKQVEKAMEIPLDESLTLAESRLRSSLENLKV